MSPDILYLQSESDRYASHAQSDHTRSEYARDWKQFTRWCAAAGRQALPASTETVSLYITDRLGQGSAIASVIRYASAINSLHRAKLLKGPADRAVWVLIKGAQRVRGEWPKGKTPLTVEQLRSICAGMADSADPWQVRNHAVLVLAFGSALRRCNLVALDLEDLEITPAGVLLDIKKAKEDQESKGRVVAVARGERAATCPVRAMERWLAVRGKAPGPLFVRITHGRPTLERLHAKNIAKVVKRGVESLGLSAGTYAAHSLRAGLATAALEAGISDIVVAAHLGHHSLGSLKRYYRPHDLFRGNCSGKIGL